MKKDIRKKLTLNKETIANLKDGALINVVGGNPTLDRLCPTRYSCPNTA